MDKNKIGKLQPVEITQEMRKSYLDYAMSVIVARALPDVKDGLKPVHRRILYAMHQMGLSHSSRYTKSAKVVGETMGKYHPHGDMAIYDSLVRLAQDFSLRYPLVDGQGNFGSIDGDSAAAMRYTEVRLNKITQEMITDIDKQTVEFRDNFDGSLKEPAFLPSKIPNLLLMGSDGIAVGMATKIPPHNLNEVVEALIFMIEKGKVVFPIISKNSSLNGLGLGYEFQRIKIQPCVLNSLFQLCYVFRIVIKFEHLDSLISWNVIIVMIPVQLFLRLNVVRVVISTAKTVVKFLVLSY